jgi:chromosomal replication initiator protein
MIPDQERWMRVMQRLRAEVGEEIFKSWFAAMGHDGIEGDTVRLSVPTRFLKSWVQSHYSDKLLACWRAELPSVRRIDLVHRSAVLRTTTAKAKPSEPVETPRESRNGSAERVEARAAQLPAQAAHEALGGSPLDPRLVFDTFVVGRSNTLAHAAAKQVASARRGEAVMFNPLYVHAGVRARQDAPVAIACLGRQRLARPQGAVPHRPRSSCTASWRRSRRRPRSPSRRRCAASTCW